MCHLFAAQGTIHLVDAAKASGVKSFILLSSLLTNAAAAGQQDNPNYKFLNLFGSVLDHKLVWDSFRHSLQTSETSCTCMSDT
jgi:hypothetical protein